MFKRNDLVEIYRREINKNYARYVTYIGRVTSASLCRTGTSCKWLKQEVTIDSFCLACSGDFVRVMLLYSKDCGGPWKVYPWKAYRRRGLKFANVNIKRITKEELALLKLEVGK